MTKFPEIVVRLSDEDGNAFSIMGKTRKALRRAKVSEADINAYSDEAMAGDYDNLLRVTMKTVKVT
jgi:hypothetical protein